MAKRFTNLGEPVKADPSRRLRIEQHKQAIRDTLASTEGHEARARLRQETATCQKSDCDCGECC